MRLFLKLYLDSKPVSCKSVGDYFCVNGKLLEEKYRDHPSNFHQWDQLSHAQEWILFPDNIGAFMSLDETALSQGEIIYYPNQQQQKVKKEHL